MTTDRSEPPCDQPVTKAYAVGDVVRRVVGQGAVHVGTFGVVVAVRSSGITSVTVQWLDRSRITLAYALDTPFVELAGPFTDDEEATLMRWRLSQ